MITNEVIKPKLPMNWFKTLSLIVLTSVSAFAQNKITGKVIRKDSSAIVSAVVNMIGTTIQANTDVIGDFTILIPDSLVDKEIVLYVSKKGYLSTQKIVDSAERQGKAVIIMLNKLNAGFSAPQEPSSPPQSAPPPYTTTTTTTISAPPPAGAEQAKTLPPGQQVPMFPWPPPEYSASAVL